MVQKKKKSIDFFRRFVFVFGYLNGVWVAIGWDPKMEIFEFLKNFESYLAPGLLFLFGLLPTMFLILMLYLVYDKARWWGFIAVLMAFAGGTMLLSAPVLSIMLLAISFVLSWFTVKKR